MISLFKQFIKERRYVKNSAENTIYYYEQCFKTYQKFLGEELPTKQYLIEFVTNMREGGIKPSNFAINVLKLRRILSYSNLSP